MMRNFEKELEELINAFSMEGESNTPDFVLARYMKECYDAFVRATNRREELRTSALAETLDTPTGETQEARNCDQR